MTLADKYSRNIVEINKAFDAFATIMERQFLTLEEGGTIQTFDEWLAAAGTAGINMEIVEDRPFVDALFGESGALANSIIAILLLTS